LSGLIGQIGCWEATRSDIALHRGRHRLNNQ
jgi:hypothetical protein